jgi:hypothetical protein
VRYSDQLRRYRTVFPSEHVLVLIYDDFRRDNETTVRRILRFLDVDDTFPVNVAEVNPTVRVRSEYLDDLVRTVSMGQGPVSRTIKAGIKTLTPRQLRRNALALTQHHIVYDNPRPPDEELMMELRHRFKPEVVALSEYLDRDFVTLWGYDRIG